MIITCQECNSSFNLDESLLKPTGSKVRCSKCHKVFVAYPQMPPEEPETPAEILSGIDDVPVTKDVPGPDELDLSDMDKLFAEEKDSEIEGLDLDLELDLEPEADTPIQETSLGVGPDKPDELDLSDMDKFFEEEKTPEDEDITDEAIEDLDLDFDLVLEPETDTSTEDIETEEKPDELDLSDMDKFFSEEKTSEVEGIEEFDLDLELEADKPIGETAHKVEPDELDLSDIEEILDLEEPEAEEKQVPNDIVLELDMETEPELEKVPEGLDSDEFEEVDLFDIEKMLEIEPAPDTQAEDLVLESDLKEEQADFALPEDSSEVDADETTEPAEAEGVMPKFEFEDEDGEDLIEEEITEIQPALDQAGPSAKKRISKPIFALLIIAILAGGLYGTYVLLDYMKIEIPFVSDYLKPKVSDPAGNLKIETIDIDSKFVTNEKTGKLFVITGRIKNGYSSSRRSIKIKGKLFTKGKTLTKTETFFCGNVLSDMELSNMEFAAIKKRLSNSLGDNKSNTGVKPGQELPFMIVFSDLPDNLEEFAIEVAGSISE
ncbi:MAG: zinc-ribbon domain-containing protein [Deltaproteobacteria bacterium]|nr:zinc-ribbon domain-containing protein [Deltaproteobacteria bacterium]